MLYKYFKRFLTHILQQEDDLAKKGSSEQRLNID